LRPRCRTVSQRLRRGGRCLHRANVPRPCASP